ncbi:hypothetical protein H2200_005246 [Cladophialophora chaetospira]|uniref:Uncharacterized protein n=1 Tax=Cladophialophora chaetospira TaxID=386627 RepID=A0AA39CIR9_9EURO|nr:hypothetical protein H2200_005246 [Cladophialophora chaetospira]
MAQFFEVSQHKTTHSKGIETVFYERNLSSPQSSASDGNSTTWSKRIRFLDCLGDQWYWEILAIIFGVACSVAIVAVLLAYDDKPLPKLSSDVTMSAIILTLAIASKHHFFTLFSSCLGQLKWTWFSSDYLRSLSDIETFDRASRGPAGALEIGLSSPRGPFTALGAFLMIAALAFDPSLQQILAVETRVNSQPSSSVFTEQAVRYQPFPYTHPAISAIHSALWRDDFERNPTCPGGKCTFTLFRFPGRCSKCEEDKTWSFADGSSLVVYSSDWEMLVSTHQSHLQIDVE